VRHGTMDSTVRTDTRPRSATSNGSLTEWPALLNRMLEDLGRVIQLEIQLLEARIAPSLFSMADRAIAGLVLLFAGAIAGSCLLAALILLLHKTMEWWECFALGGAVAIVCGLVAFAGLRSMRT
jgi:hypothetical protein